MNHVSKTIEEILFRYKVAIRNKWIERGACGCKRHDNTYLMVNLKTNAVLGKMIGDIKEALEQYQIELASISAGHEKDDTFLRLGIFFEQFHNECIASDRCKARY